MSMAFYFRFCCQKKKNVFFSKRSTVANPYNNQTTGKQCNFMKCKTNRQCLRDVIGLILLKWLLLLGNTQKKRIESWKMLVKKHISSEFTDTMGNI